MCVCVCVCVCMAGSMSNFCDFNGIAYQGKDIVFRFIIECSSLRDFGP
jgi:hypothetical protein